MDKEVFNLLEYLFQNDNGDYFEIKKIPGFANNLKDYRDKIIRLKEYNWIEFQTDKFLLNNIPENWDQVKLRITEKGRKEFQELSIQSHTKWFQKKKILWYIIGVLVTIILFFMKERFDQNVLDQVNSQDPSKVLLNKKDRGISEFKDARDNRLYKVVKISNKIWLAENLQYIPREGNSFCYRDDSKNCLNNGRLYTWDQAMKACPNEWRLPTIQEWIDLANTFGGLNYNSLPREYKRTYNSLLKGGDSGFSLTMTGWRSESGLYFNLGEEDYFWSSTINEKGEIKTFNILHEDEETEIGANIKTVAYPCRCIKSY